MPSFYRSQLMANKEIDRILEQAKKNHVKEFSVSSLVLNITSRFEVGDKLIYKRINLLILSDPEGIELRGDILEFK
jgi:hypothetical protein